MLSQITDALQVLIKVSKERLEARVARMKGRHESESEQGESVCTIDFSLPNCVKTFENNNNKKNNKPLLPQLWARLWIIHRLIRVGHVMAVYKLVSVE